MNALTDFASGTNAHSQTERARDDQVKNNAGGFVFNVGPFEALKRFLVLGTEGGTYYASQKAHTIQAVDSLKQAVKEDGRKTVDLIVEISTSGRGLKNDQAIFALAYVAGNGDDESRKYALSKVNDVCRTGTHLFQFANFVQEFRGWGRGLRKAISNWYESKAPDQIAYQAAKYVQRDGWSHRDLFRLAHPTFSDSVSQNVASFITHPDTFSVHESTPAIIEGYVKIREAKSADDAAKVIREFDLTHDMVPTEFKADPKVWDALLDVGIPYNALVRNLGVMSKNGTIKALGGRTSEIVAQLTDANRVSKSRIHPFAVLVAQSTYKNGGGWRGNSNWDVNSDVVDALEDAYYLAFGNVTPSGKRTFIGVDCSGSMGVPFGDSALTCRDAAAAFSMVTVRTEPNVYVRGFTSAGGYRYGGGDSQHVDDGLADIGITKKQSLSTVVDKMARFSWGGTDCALPMLHAEAKGLEVDTFVVITDNETWAGTIQPFEALKRYRKSSGISDAKLVVVGMTATPFSIADQKDAGMLDVVGFDTAAPQLISDFSAGNI